MMELGQVGFWGTGLIGILAGYIGHRIIGGSGGIFWNLIVGIVGSYIGFFVADKAGIHLGEFFHGWFWGNLIGICGWCDSFARSFATGAAKLTKGCASL